MRVVVVGASGSGRSAFARRLGAAIGAPSLGAGAEEKQAQAGGAMPGGETNHSFRNVGPSYRLRRGAACPLRGLLNDAVDELLAGPGL